MQFIVEGYPAYAYTGGKPFDPARSPGLLIHGAAFDHSVWQWQSRYLAHQGFGVLAVDLPAHGRSPGDARRDIAALAHWVAALSRPPASSASTSRATAWDRWSPWRRRSAHRDKLATLALIGTAAPMAVGEPFLAAARERSGAALRHGSGVGPCAPRAARCRARCPASRCWAPAVA